MKSKTDNHKQLQAFFEINLVDFVHYFGKYVIDEEKTAKENTNKHDPKYIFVRNQEGDLLLISKSISNGQLQYYYKNLHNDLDKGNILNFIKNRDERYSFSFVKKKIDNYLSAIRRNLYTPIKTQIDLKYGDFKNLNEVIDIGKMRDRFAEFPVLFDKKYLVSRGLDFDFMDKPFLRNSIKNEIFRIADHTEKKFISYVNTVFPIHSKIDKSELCGYVRRNEAMKKDGPGSFKSLGIWVSDTNNSKITHLIVSENPIDSMSYAQMKLDLRSANPILAASNGEPNKTQISLYQDLIDKHLPETIVFAYDNANSGQYFNSKILSNISLPKQLYDEPDYFDKNHLIVTAEIKTGRLNDHKAEITWRISHNQKPDNMNIEQFIVEHIPAFQQIREYYENQNRELISVNDQEEVFKIEPIFRNNYSEVKVVFENNIENWKSINESILALKFDNSACLKIEVAVEKDFNEDLQKSKGIFQLNSKEMDKGRVKDNLINNNL